jgi:hypothetical protein
LNAARNKALPIHGQGKALTETGHQHTILSGSVSARTKLSLIKPSFQIIKLLQRRLRIRPSARKKEYCRLERNDTIATKNEVEDPKALLRCTQRRATKGGVQDVKEEKKEKENVVARPLTSTALALWHIRGTIATSLPSSIPNSGIVTKIAINLVPGGPRFRAVLVVSTIAVFSAKRRPW